MKTKRFFFAALAIFAALVSCTPEEQPADNGDDNGKENGNNTPGETKSSECKLTAFVVTIDGKEVEVFIDQTDKTIELSYLPLQFEALKTATAEVTISEKATISPDPAEPHDYTSEGGVEYTVTAEDGTTNNVYTVYAAPADIRNTTEMKWSKTYDQMGLAASRSNMCGVGFVDRGHFATSDFNVYDLNGTKVGTLNTTGIPGFDHYNGQLGAMSNDVNGILVAFAEYTSPDATNGDGVLTETWAWLDGYDKAPTLIYGPFDYPCNYMSVSGDVKGDFILTFRTGAQAGPQMHHVIVFKNGQYFNGEGGSAGTWNAVYIPHPGNDGCWGQLLSFFSGDPNDGFICWDSMGAAEHEDWDYNDDGTVKVDQYGNPTGNASSAYYYYSSLSGAQSGAIEEVPLYGGVTWANWDSQGKYYNYGNFSTGHVRAFIYNGDKCIIACSGSWPCTWITVQKADNLVEDDPDTDEIDESESNYLLPTDRINDASQCYPCCAYVFDPAAGIGHIIYLSQSAYVLAYDLSTSII
ncbi:MAG: DUF5018 domain-containing protein [Bacteroidales bacterium]|nr:DUF5018 domain-containing protein [Bacteroidales bacterium]